MHFIFQPSSSASSFFIIQTAGGILEVENVKAGAGEGGGEQKARRGSGRAVLTGKRC